MPVGFFFVPHDDRFVHRSAVLNSSAARAESISGASVARARPRLAADPARHRTAQGLVRLARHPNIEAVALRLRPGRAHRSRDDDRPSRRRFARAQESFFQRGCLPHRPLGIRPLRQPRSAAAIPADADGLSRLHAGLALSPRGIGALLFTSLVGHIATKTDRGALLVVGIRSSVPPPCSNSRASISTPAIGTSSGHRCCRESRSLSSSFR